MAQSRGIKPNPARGSGITVNLHSCRLRCRQEISDGILHHPAQLQDLAPIPRLARFYQLPDGGGQRGHFLRLAQDMSYNLAILFSAGSLE
jgi:hypothetical protein